MKIGHIYFHGSHGTQTRVHQIHNYLKTLSDKITIEELPIRLDKRLGIYQKLRLLWRCKFMPYSLSFEKKSHLKYSLYKHYVLHFWDAAFRQVADSLMERIRDCDILFGETNYGAYVAYLTGKKFIYDMHGFSWAEAEGRHRDGFLSAYFESLEKVMIAKADKIIVVCDFMKQFLLKHRFVSDPSRIVIMENGALIKDQHVKFRTPLKVIYAGGFEYYECVDTYLDTAKLMSGNKQFEFYLMGKGRLANHLLSRIKKESIPVEYLGNFNDKDCEAQLVTMQVGIAPSTRDLTRQAAWPVKIMEYASLGLPVITVDVGDWSAWVARHKCGICLSEGSPEKLQSALMSLSDAKIWQEFSANARNAITAKYQWKALLQKLNFLNEY